VHLAAGQTEETQVSVNAVLAPAVVRDSEGRGYFAPAPPKNKN